MKKLTIIAALSASLLSSACAVTSAGVKPGDERNFSRSLNDVSAERVLNARLKRAEGFDLNKVDVEVAEGIVVLTGHVATADDRIEAERIAWSAPHVQEIGNEITVGPRGNALLSGTKNNVLGSSVRARLIADKSVKSRNVNIETENGVVYLLGVARTPEELERTAYIASTTKGVKEVVSYMRVHNAPTPQLAQQSVLQATPQTGQQALPGFLSTTPSGGGAATSPQAPIDPLAPYYRDPATGERIELDAVTGTIPFRPAAEAALGGLASPQSLAPNVTALTERLTDFPSDEALGRFRTGAAGEAASIIESAPYYIDPDTGKEIPVKFTR